MAGKCKATTAIRITTLPAALVGICALQGLLLVILDHYRHGFSENRSRPLASPIRTVNTTSSRASLVLAATSMREDETENRNSNVVDNNGNIHIVFSTDCSGYQHWQGILLYYSALRVHQRGTITRIASGCTAEQQTTIQAEWNQIDPTREKFRVHFAPTTALHGSYKYSNKPGGILHWLQHTTSSLDKDTVVCLLDPDMVLLRPITNELIAPEWTARKTIANNKVVEYVNAQGVAQRMRLANLPYTEDFPNRITTGHPAGQHFGVGGAWVQGMRPQARDAWKNFSKARVCGSSAPCTTTSMEDASRKYAVGPVYLATVQDWERIANTWFDFVPRVHEQYPFLLAEMYALTMAVANLELEFALFSNYMATGADVNSPTEAWSWVDRVIEKEDPQHICRGVSTFQPPEWTLETDQVLALPTTLHYCQNYKLDRNGQSFLFAKRKIPPDVFSCSSAAANSDLLPVPFGVENFIHEIVNEDATTLNKDRRTIFALCHLVPILNWARKQYHIQVCRK